MNVKEFIIFCDFHDKIWIMNRHLTGVLVQVNSLEILLKSVNSLEPILESNLSKLKVGFYGVDLLVLLFINEAQRKRMDVLALGQPIQIPESILAANAIDLLTDVQDFSI